MRHASTVLVVQIPGTGDSVQSVKAGILEIGDIYVVNKADLPGAEKLVSALVEMLHLSASVDGWQAPVHSAEASNGTGIEQLVATIENHCKAMNSGSLENDDKAELRARHRVAEICHQLLSESIFSGQNLSRSQLHDMIERRTDPYSLAENLVETKAQ